MNYADWYTDRMDIHRVKPVTDGALTRHERVQVSEDVPCRIYRSGVHGPRMQSTAAYMESTDDKLACDNAVDVRPGDELHIYRGKGLGRTQQPIRAFAGEPARFYEPFGAVIPGLAHQEIALLQKEYLNAEAEEGANDGAGRRAAEAHGGAGEAPAYDREAAGGDCGGRYPPGGGRGNRTYTSQYV